MAMYNVRWRSQVFTSWCGEIQTNFLFTEIAVFLMYREIYLHIFASPNSLYSILTSVLCKKIEAILTQIPCCREALWLYRFKYPRTICSAISVKPRGMVQPIATAVLETFIMTNKDGAHHPTSTCCFFLWRNMK